MSDRPLSVTIVAWLLLIGGLANFGLAIAFASFDPASAARLEARGLHVIPIGALFLFEGLVRLVCGYALLRGLSIARVAFLAWGPFAMIWILFAIGSTGMMIKYAIFYAFFARVMFTRAANIWFEEAYA